MPIFYEDFYVWPLGPISPVLHEALSDYNYFSFNFLAEYDSKALDEMQIYCIDKVLRGYIDLAPEKFMALPVNEAPWSRAYKKGDAVISKETLLDYYAGLLVPDKMKDKIKVEMGSPMCFEENSRKMANDQVASVSKSPNDIDEEKNKLIEERKACNRAKYLHGLRQRSQNDKRNWRGALCLRMCRYGIDRSTVNYYNESVAKFRR